MVKLRTVLTICTFSLLLGCYSVKTPTFEAKGIGKVSVSHCIATQEVRPPLMPEPEQCTKIESHGFTGYPYLDGILASLAVFFGAM